jgi:hypothetical protein
MAWHPMKPETAARRAREHAEDSARRHVALVATLCEKAARDSEGEGGIWAEMLAETLERDGETR